LGEFAFDALRQRQTQAMELHGNGRVLFPGAGTNFRHTAALGIAGHQQLARITVDPGDALPHRVGKVGIILAGILALGMLIEEELESIVSANRFGAEFPQVVAEMVFGDSPQPRSEGAGQIEVCETSPRG
jgi:hypothetical protein